MGDWRWGWRLPSREPSCRHCQSQSLPSSFLIPRNPPCNGRGSTVVSCMSARAYSMCLIYCTNEQRQVRQHQYQCDPIAIRRDSMRCNTVQYDTIRCTARCRVCHPASNGALTLPPARVKHQEQAAATAMTVSDEAHSCGSTSQRFTSQLAASWLGWLGWLDGPGPGWLTTDG